MKKILLLSVLFSLANCAFGQSKYKEGAKVYFDSTSINAKKARQIARINRPVYFDVGLGTAYQNNTTRNYFRGRAELHYNASVVWQKTPWLGLSFNYSSFGNSSYDGLKSLGISWRARPRNGYVKATINLLNEFGPNANYYFRSRWIERIYFKKRVPPGFNFEAGVRCWDMLLLKIGCQIQTPFDLEVTNFTDEVVFIDGEYIYKTTGVERIELSYFHLGIGFIL